MHLTWLGVVKRIIYFLKHGPAVCRLSYQQMCDISKKMQFLSGKLPSEFARQPRSMFEVERWKATEFRQFLLYTGPVVLKDIISDTMYEHFLSLSVAISILLTSDQDKRMAYLEYAQQLLNFFVDKSIEIYTETFLVYNVHCLKHLPEDVRNFNCSLNDISSFPYENHLQTIKRLVRNARSPVVQVCKRLTEIEMAGNRKLPIKTANGIFVSPKKNWCFQMEDESYGFVLEKTEDASLICTVIPQSRTESFFLVIQNLSILHIYVFEISREEFAK